MNRRFDKNPKAFCPYCKSEIDRPTKNTLRPVSPFPAGHCSCGAVYVSDLTGKNGGEALLEALATLCGNDEEKAWALEEGKDYMMRIVGYEARTHTLTKRGHYKDGKARLYIVKLEG